MTVSVPGDLIRTYAGDGSTTAFSYPVRFDEDDELIVILRDSDGNDTVKALGSDYTVSGEGNDAGGTVTFTTAPASSVTVVIYRSTEETQVVDLENASRNDAGAVELQLDRMVRMIQDHSAELGRTAKAPPGKAGPALPDSQDGSPLVWDGVNLANGPAPEEGRLLGWHNGALTNRDVVTLPNAPAGATGLDVLAAETADDARDTLAVGTHVTTRTALKALDTTKDTVAYLTEEGREGQFVWRAGDYSVEVASDTQEGIYVKADAISAASGVWVRAGGWAVEGSDIRWFGAVCDGVSDDTVALQACAERGGTYKVPIGVTRTTAPIIPARPCVFYGLGVIPIIDLVDASPSGGAHTRGPGSWFHFDHAGVGFDVDGTNAVTDSVAFIAKGCGSFRSQPTPTEAAFTPGDFDWDLRFTDCDVTLEWFCLNSTRFLHARLSRAGRIRVDARGQPLLRGIDIDQIYDVSEVTAHFWAFWSLADTVTAYTKANLRPLITGRVDGLVIPRYFSIYAEIAWHIVDNGFGSITSGSVNYAYLDLCGRAILIDSSVTTGSIAIDYLNCYGLSTENSTGILVLSSNFDMDVGRGYFSTHRQQALYIAGTGNTVRIGRPSFTDYGFANASTPGVVVEAGNTLILDGRVQDSPLAGRTLFSAHDGVVDSPDYYKTYVPSTLDTGGGTGFVFGTTAFAYRVQGEWVDVTFDITVTNVGSGGGSVRFSLPLAQDGVAVGTATEILTSGSLLNAKATTGDNLVRITTPVDAFPAVNGSRIIGSIRYSRS
ncbi:hypothetical protein [Nitratireductor basaltis]|uniref:Tail fiber protein n=1 Tax=Nitratireductor basaltis TaxID=472175 RepID=A0A084UDI7_9HYPH|nr:hypothetical protein [Nitratireductor basaltis]KFB11023.1 hypothetical protein EL18_02065 [Nitratireductor basaltis]